MKIKLLKSHIINDTLFESETIIGDGGVSIPVNYVFTPFMEGLDEEGRKAVYEACVRVYGRYPRYGPHVLIDDPPIPRPEGEEQPVPHVPQKGPGR